jgi:hypothetical protein
MKSEGGISVPVYYFSETFDHRPARKLGPASACEANDNKVKLRIGLKLQDEVIIQTIVYQKASYPG